MCCLWDRPYWTLVLGINPELSGSGGGNASIRPQTILERCKVLLYVDDSVILFSGRSVAALVEVLNHEVNLLNKWISKTNLILNLNKSKTELAISGTGQKLAKQPSYNVP